MLFWTFLFDLFASDDSKDPKMARIFDPINIVLFFSFQRLVINLIFTVTSVGVVYELFIKLLLLFFLPLLKSIIVPLCKCSIPFI